MRFKEAQANPGNNSQGFFMFFEMPDVPHKRPVSRSKRRAAVTYDLPEKNHKSRNLRRENEETPRGHPRRFQSGMPPAIKSPGRTCEPGRGASS